MKPIRVWLSLIALAALVGCSKVDYEFYLNPDGSGKVVLKTSFEPSSVAMQYGVHDLMYGYSGERDEEDMQRKVVPVILKKHRGVAAWKDIKVGKKKVDVMMGGMPLTTLDATGYFRDVRKVRLPPLKDLGALTFSIADGGRIAAQFEFKEDEADDPEDDEDEDEDEMMTKKELQTMVKQMRRQIKQSLEGPFAEQMKAVGYGITVHLPGAIESANNIEKVDDQTIRLSLDAEKLKKFFGAIEKDDDYWRRVAEKGGAMNRPVLPEDMGKYMKIVFGQEGGIAASSGPSSKALFDFEAELKEATASYKAWLEKNEPKLPPAVGAGAEFVDLKVAGIQYVFRASAKKGIRPFRENVEGVKLAVIGRLSGSVLRVQNGQIVAIEDDNGEDLMRDQEHGGARISNIRLSRDRTIVLFEVAGRLPSEDAEGFDLIEGKMSYTSAAGTKKKELGWLELKTGAKGESGVIAVKMAHRQRHWSNLILEVKMPQHELKRLVLYDEAGEEVEAMDRSSMRHHYAEEFDELIPEELERPKDQHDRHINFQRKMPQKAKVVAEIYDNLAKGELKFKLEDVDLLAR